MELLSPRRQAVAIMHEDGCSHAPIGRVLRTGEVMLSYPIRNGARILTHSATGHFSRRAVCSKTSSYAYTSSSSISFVSVLLFSLPPSDGTVRLRPFVEGSGFASAPILRSLTDTPGSPSAPALRILKVGPNA